MNEIIVTKCPACGHVQHQEDNLLVRCAECGDLYDTALFPKTKITMDAFIHALVQSTKGG